MRNYAGHRLAPWLAHVMVSRQDTARALLTPGEVMQLPPSDELVLVAGTPPIRASKLRYFEDRTFSARVIAPPVLGDGTYADRPPLRSNDWGNLARRPDVRLAAKSDADAEDSSGGLEQARHPAHEVEVNALLAEMAHLDERVILIEDTRELQCPAPDTVALRTRAGSIGMADLVRSTLRLRPDRIIVGEARGPGTTGFYGNTFWTPPQGAGNTIPAGNGAGGTPADYVDPVFTKDYAILDTLNNYYGNQLLLVKSLFATAQAS